MLALGQKRNLLEADCFHATTDKEFEEIRRFGLVQPVTVIPNGIDLPDATLLDIKKHRSKRRLLYLGRVHSQKGIETLLNIWPTLSERFPEWELIICGPGEESYLKKVQRTIKKIGTDIHYHEPVYGDEKTSLFASSDLYILPTETENFGISVAEAMAHKLPVVVSKEAPWSAIAERQCGWWVDNEESAYLEVLCHACALTDSERSRRGEIGYQWMAKDYGWEAIARNMYQTYLWLLGKASKPNCIQLD